MNWENLLKISTDDNMYLRNDDQGLEKYIRVGLAGVNAICGELDRINLWPNHQKGLVCQCQCRARI